MNWNSWGEFFEMGGYALYVWSSVVVTFALLALELIQIKRARFDAIRWVGLNAEKSAEQ